MVRPEEALGPDVEIAGVVAMPLDVKASRQWPIARKGEFSGKDVGKALLAANAVVGGDQLPAIADVDRRRWPEGCQIRGARPMYP